MQEIQKVVIVHAESAMMVFTMARCWGSESGARAPPLKEGQ